MTARLTAAILLAVVIAAGTTACSSATAEPETPAVTTPAAAPTPTPVVESKAYTMTDGTVVAVDPTQPMPAAVLADITAISQATEDALPAENPKSPNDPNLSIEALGTIGRAEAAASKSTGRDVVIVYRILGAPNTDIGGPSRWIWVATRGAAQAGIEDKAARVAEVQAFIATQENPAGWDLIVLT